MLQSALTRRYEEAELRAFSQSTVSASRGQQSRFEAWKAGQRNAT